VNVFILKLNSAHCPGGIGRPTHNEEWEGGAAVAPPVRSLRSSNGTPPGVASGDIIFVWVHESKDYGNGRGLTAQCTAGAVMPQGDKDNHITLLQVELFKPPMGFDRLRTLIPDNDVLTAIHDYTLRQLLWLDDEQAGIWTGGIDAAYAGHQSKLEAAALEHGVAGGKVDPFKQALQDDAVAIADAAENRFRQVEDRPRQAAFRATLIDMYGGRCLLSGSRTPEVLEAAHVVPFSENVPGRDDALNGLLLRADLHKLFDAYLLTIEPEKKAVVVSASLADTGYWKLSGRTVKAKAASNLLRHHYDRFQEAEVRRATDAGLVPVQG
jgi:hypothetical protein